MSLALGSSKSQAIFLVAASPDLLALPYLKFSVNPLQLEHISLAIVLSLALHSPLMDSLTILTSLVFIHSYAGLY